MESLKRITHADVYKTGLPLRSKVAIRLYPVLLLVTIALWLAVIVWAARLILN